MEIIEKSIESLVPYANNPRINDNAVEAVANSIKEFGFKVPIVVDSNNIIVAGHTRYKAAKYLGMRAVPCIVADDLTEEQIKAFRLADNKTSELAIWDESKLADELAEIVDIKMEDFGFIGDKSDNSVTDDNPYTMKAEVPQYEPTGDQPPISALMDVEKSNVLIDEINNSNVTEEEKIYLREAAKRHTVFNYKNAAEYYAHASPEMQKLMEHSALVIIDVDNAIANGFVQLDKDLKEIFGIEDDE